MRRGSAESLSRTAALIAVGAFAVHQLRYLAGYGHAAGAELSRQGHGYLDQGRPVLAAFVLSALAAGLLRAGLGRARGGAGLWPSASDTVRRRVVLYSIAIGAAFCCQESLEGALAAGHPAGSGAVLVGGGWLALPFSVLIGALCALLDRGLVTLERALAAAEDSRPGATAPTDSPRPHPAGLVPLAAAPLAFGIARRPPPPLQR